MSTTVVHGLEYEMTPYKILSHQEFPKHREEVSFTVAQRHFCFTVILWLYWLLAAGEDKVAIQI